jgi:hypothetical protein
MSSEQTLIRELQAAHDAVRHFDFAQDGQTDYARMIELRRRLAIKRAARSRVDAAKARFRSTH